MRSVSFTDSPDLPASTIARTESFPARLSIFSFRVTNEKEQISGIFFLSRFNLARRKNSSLPLSLSSSSCGALCPLPSPFSSPEEHPHTPVRVHRVRARGRRRGAPRRNIDVPLEHQIESDDRNDDAPRNGVSFFSSRFVALFAIAAR